VADLGSLTDSELFDAWLRGDARAAAELFERHFDAIARFFRNKVIEGHEDLVQQTFAACLESRDRFRGWSLRRRGRRFSIFSLRIFGWRVMSRTRIFGHR